MRSPLGPKYIIYTYMDNPNEVLIGFNCGAFGFQLFNLDSSRTPTGYPVHFLQRNSRITNTPGGFLMMVKGLYHIGKSQYGLNRSHKVPFFRPAVGSSCDYTTMLMRFPGNGNPRNLSRSRKPSTPNQTPEG